VVLKPSEFTSVGSLATAALCKRVGLPNGILNVVTGTGEEAGNCLSTHRDVRRIGFTESLPGGRAVAAVAAQRIVPIGLELDGKSANIVFADADLDAAVAGDLWSCCRHSSVRERRSGGRLANDSDYGLVAGIWTKDVVRALRVVARIEAGQIFVNEHFAGGVETPFGGLRQSGLGREKGIEALRDYTQVKSVSLRL
jgi:acyl-CoA reductase-like NAD-dependent aldehyde dehydrogenase